ncbi:gamma-glutamyltranspeptidase [Phlyctochytrium arcticum]|nr:gamma-glutamyltranspeptidase [Phlyctochytrium arcticum]
MSSIATEVLTHEKWPFESRRSTIYSRKGMVAATQPLAVQAGLDILRKGVIAGGNAADAAIAVAACKNVTEPGSTGVGGDCFCLFYDSKTKTTYGLNGSGRAPAGLTLDLALSRGFKGSIPVHSALAITVPGAAAGWIDIVEKFGSRKLGMSEILAPAIDLAENGFPVSEVSAHIWKGRESLLKNQSPGGKELLVNGQTAPEEGQMIKLPELARTLKELAQSGKDGFYKGRIAESIVQAVTAAGGVLTLQDLANHTTTFTEPLSIQFEDFRLHEHPPNGQGLVALLAFGIVSELQKSGAIPDMSQIPHNSAPYLHIIIESLRLAFADGRLHIADPDISPAPVERLLSQEYLAERAKLFDPKSATVDPKNGSPVHSSDTVYFAVVDSEGNACSFINSLYTSFGTGIVPEGTGIALQSRASNFSLQAGHSNVVAPGKRPYHTIIPAMVTNAATNDLEYCFGVMGGFMQPQGQLQVLLNLRKHNFSIQGALDAPRICIAPEESTVYVEEGIAPTTISELQAMGHKIKIMRGHERAIFGRGQIIGKLADGVLAGGSDPRGDGCAAPQI